MIRRAAAEAARGAFLFGRRLVAVDAAAVDVLGRDAL
jgi:hypothetical protein